jgi:hypothetical protein
MFVVNKGVRHNPVADRPCLVMLVERRTTLHTGSVMTDRTRSLAEQLRLLPATPQGGDQQGSKEAAAGSHESAHSTLDLSL